METLHIRIASGAVVLESYLQYDWRMTQAAYEKVSLTIDADVLAAVRQRVPARGLSGYATAALRRQLELDDLQAVIDDLAEVNGPADPAQVAHYAKLMRAHR
jgi:arginase family enzyme